MRFYILPLAAVLILAACDPPKSDNKAVPDHVTNNVDTWERTIVPNPSEGNDTAIPDVPGARTSEIAKPEDVVKKLLEYAAKGQKDSIKAICDPQAANDPQAVCNAGSDVISKLGHASMGTPINTEGKTAIVPITYNPQAPGAKAEKAQVRLTMRKGQWYVVKIESYMINNQ